MTRSGFINYWIPSSKLLKRIILPVLLILFCAPGPGTAQPSPILLSRIDEVRSEFRADPGGFDTLFTPYFLSQVPGPQLAQVFVQYYQNFGVVSSWKFIDSSEALSAKLDVKFSKGFHAQLSISVSGDSLHLIDGLFLTNGTPIVSSLEDIVHSLSELPGRTNFLAARLDKDSLHTIAELHSSDALALGSAFKLFVLSELIREIESGKRHWQDVVTIDSASRSFPSGELHAWPVGSPVTLATLATQMISHSDNTATDLLIHTLGRSSIEQMYKSLSPNFGSIHFRPFLTTLEMFKLKSVKNGAYMQKYLSLSDNDRESYIKKTIDTLNRLTVDVGDPSTPIAVDSIEWFASPRQLANALNYIRQHTEKPNMRLGRDLLSVNPGLRFDKSKWKFAGFKGGSEPGVLDLTFLLQAQPGEWYILTGTWNNTTHSLDEKKFEGLIQEAIDLLGR